MAQLPDGRAVPGKLCIVEGMYGSGKRTQLDLLRKCVISQGYCVAFSEWNSSQLVKATTKLGKKKQMLTPTSFSLIHAADLADRTERQILPALKAGAIVPVSYTHLRAHETVLDLVCRLLLEKKKKTSKSERKMHMHYMTEQQEH